MTFPDILIFMSDQHASQFSSFEGGPARTPNLEKLCENGTRFSQAYTPSPICLPARTAMLLGQYPCHTGIYRDGAIPETTPTFLHSMVAAGYETVLIGRMHFVGMNQRCGFTRRLVGDMTPVTWNRPSRALSEERGVFKGCYRDPGCVNVIGGGDSPVLEFDQAVVAAALDYLSRPHEKPQCIVVGTYGPHFPYVAPPDRYRYYKERAEVPESFKNPPDFIVPVYKDRMLDVPEDTVINARAAYFGMIETIDQQLGQVKAAFDTYLEHSGNPGIFAYTSDHGDHAGDKRIFGKQTFFEPSARIPMIFEGHGIVKGQVVNAPVSLIDLGPTLCDLTGISLPMKPDGVSLAETLTDCRVHTERTVFSEILLNKDAQTIPCLMVRKGDFKYITFHGYEQYDMLFDMRADADEMKNLAKELPAKTMGMRSLIPDDWDGNQIVKEYAEYSRAIELVRIWEKESGIREQERWNRNPDPAKKRPEII